MNFLNDAYGGTAATDRNLYVAAMSFNGTNYPANTASLLSAGPVSFTIPASSTATTTAPTATTTPTAPQPVTVGTGSDALVVTVNEDAYQGDAQFTVSVDGTQVGGTQTTTALRGSGQTQAFTFKGGWGSGQHSVGISFLNDAYGGSADKDRNLYVNGLSYDGSTVAITPASLQTNGTATLVIPAGTGSTSSTATASPRPVTIGSGRDSLVVTLNEDPYQGDAQFTVSVDGTQVGGTQTTTAVRGSGQTQAFTFKGGWGSGRHSVGISFLNDAYGGSADKDRNLYVNGLSYDGRTAAITPTALMANGTANFVVS